VGKSVEFADNADKMSVSYFVQAENAYKEGNFEEAIKNYEEILKAGRESGDIYFNLGNAYYRLGKYGKAVLEYERAKAFIPRDGDLSYNLKMALKQAGDPPEFKQDTLLQRAVSEHINFYTRDEMVFIIVLSLLLAGVLHLLSMALHFPAGLRNLSIVFCLTVFLVFAAGFILKLQYEDGLAIMTDNASAKFEPTENSTIHYELLQGSKARLIKTEDNWAKIERMDGRLGWVPAEKLETIN
jgi:tetratricopeptide (TPR) repeat protein